MQIIKFVFRKQKNVRNQKKKVGNKIVQNVRISRKLEKKQEVRKSFWKKGKSRKSEKQDIREIETLQKNCTTKSMK